MSDKPWLYLGWGLCRKQTRSKPGTRGILSRIWKLWRWKRAKQIKYNQSYCSQHTSRTSWVVEFIFLFTVIAKIWVNVLLFIIIVTSVALVHLVWWTGILYMSWWVLKWSCNVFTQCTCVWERQFAGIKTFKRYLEAKSTKLLKLLEFSGDSMHAALSHIMNQTHDSTWGCKRIAWIHPNMPAEVFAYSYTHLKDIYVIICHGPGSSYPEFGLLKYFSFSILFHVFPPLFMPDTSFRVHSDLSSPRCSVLLCQSSCIKFILVCVLSLPVLFW